MLKKHYFVSFGRVWPAGLKAACLPLLLIAAFLISGCAHGAKATPEEEKPEEKIEEASFSEFIIGVGDTIAISVYNQEDLNRTNTIDPSGRIMYPLVGDVEVADKSIFKLRDELQEKLSKYYVKPQVLISVTEIQSRKVVVSGAVSNPGFFTLGTNITITDALAQAGGVATDANRNRIYLIRRNKDKRPEVIEFDYFDILESGDFSRDIMLRSGDIVYVPTTKLAALATVMSQISAIIDPVVRLESGIVLWPDVKAVLKGEEAGESNVIVP